MIELKAGQYYGTFKFEHNNEGLLVSDMEYTHKEVGWHRHENPYFTFLLAGGLYEENKKESYYLRPGTLIYHNWQDTHRNVKADCFTRGFHLEFEASWLTKYGINCPEVAGKLGIDDPLLKRLMLTLVLESKAADAQGGITTDLLALSILDALHNNQHRALKTKPTWVSRLRELLREDPECPKTALELSREIGIHPVHFSREFHTYFGMSFSRYMRLLRLERAGELLLATRLSLTEVAYQSGYFDQSHFIRDFKKEYGRTPKQFHRLLGC